MTTRRHRTLAAVSMACLASAPWPTYGSGNLRNVARTTDLADEIETAIPLKDDAIDDDSTSWPPFPKPVAPGVGFSRSINELNDKDSLMLNFSGGECKSRDEYGNNSCHFEWGSLLVANYTVKLNQPLDVGDMLTGSFKVDHIVPYGFSCAVCGQDCVLKIPVVNLEWQFPTPPCPINGTVIDSIVQSLGDSSPTDGVPVHLEGDLQIVRSDDTEVAKFSVAVDIK